MLAKLQTYSLLGLDALGVEAEVDISPKALPKTVLVGLPEAAVRESTHRVARAMANSGFTVPRERVVINLAPADLPKQAASFDLPIALGMLAAAGQLKSSKLDRYAVVGELALDGTTRPIKGALSMAIATAKDERLEGLIVPAANAAEAAVVEDVDILPVASLSDAAQFFAAGDSIDPYPHDADSWRKKRDHYEIDFADVRGQETAKRTAVIAAAGGHNLLMIGPPGSGKTMLAKRVPSRSYHELTRRANRLKRASIYSTLGKLDPAEPLLSVRPFREPHHTISHAGLAGRWLASGARVRSASRITACCFSTNSRSSTATRSRSSANRSRMARVTISRALGHLYVPSGLHAHCRAQSLSLRLSHRPAARLPLHASADRTLHEQDQRPAFGSHRFASSRSRPSPIRDLSRSPLRLERAARRCARRSTVRSQRPEAAVLLRSGTRTQRPDDAPADSHVLQTGFCRSTVAQDGNGRGGSFSAGPRQNTPRGPHDRRS